MQFGHFEKVGAAKILGLCLWPKGPKKDSPGFTLGNAVLSRRAFGPSPPPKGAEEFSPGLKPLSFVHFCEAGIKNRRIVNGMNESPIVLVLVLDSFAVGWDKGTRSLSSLASVINLYRGDARAQVG
jgi:hypothetical protein